MAELLPNLSPEDRQHWHDIYVQIWGEEPSDEELDERVTYTNLVWYCKDEHQEY